MILTVCLSISSSTFLFYQHRVCVKPLWSSSWEKQSPTCNKPFFSLGLAAPYPSIHSGSFFSWSRPKAAVPACTRGWVHLQKRNKKKTQAHTFLQTNTTVDAKCWAFVECSMFIHMLHTPFKRVKWSGFSLSSHTLVSCSHLILRPKRNFYAQG